MTKIAAFPPQQRPDRWQLDWGTTLPSQAQFIASRAPEVLHSGSYGSGKTRGLCQKAVWLSLSYPGNVGLLCRKTRTSLMATTARTLLESDGHLPPVLPPWAIRRIDRRDVFRIVLYNGSEIILGGLRSSDGTSTWLASLNLGWAGVDQAEELTENEWLLLQGRLRLSKPPVRQLFGACNPRDGGHWLYRRFFSQAVAGTDLIESNTLSNPYLPEDYLSRLRTFTGIYYERFVLGRWVSLEGLVYPNFDPTVHIIDRFPLDKTWRRWRSVDFGYTNPCVCLWACEVGAANAGDLPEGSIVIYREYYFSRRRAATNARLIREYSGDETYQATYADHDAGDRAEFSNQGVGTTAAQKDVGLGIQTVAQWLGNTEDPETGETIPPRLYFFRDALVEVDHSLTIDPLDGRRRHAPVRTADEFAFYRWPKASGERAVKETPIKAHDHGMDALRYLLYSAFGNPSTWAGGWA